MQKIITGSTDITIKLTQCEIDALVALRYNVGSLGVIPNIFNDINSRASYNTFLNHIMIRYDNLVKENSSLAQFLDGWRNRAKLILNVYFYNDYGSMPINAVKGVYNKNNEK